MSEARTDNVRPLSTRARAHEASSGLVVTLPPEMIEAISQRVTELLAEQAPSGSGGGWLRGADRIAEYIDAPVSRVYALSSAGRIPVERDGSSLIARRSELDAWVQGGGGRRP